MNEESAIIEFNPLDIPKVIVLIWAIGPSYRNRLKSRLQYTFDIGYPHILPYIILTDVPGDFYELRDKTDKIIEILDIHEEREKYSPWSKNIEYLCQERYDEVKYSEEFVHARRCLGKNFSYATHRFAFPRISELGYNRLLHSDHDVDIRYDKIVNGEITEEKFWEQFNTPVNSMKGLDYQTFYLDNQGMWYGNASIIVGNVLRYVMQQRHPEFNHLHCLHHEHTQTECGFRYYHFADASLVKKYFDLWDEIAYMMLHSPSLKQSIGAGGYVDIDNVMHTVLCDLLKMSIISFEREYYRVNFFNSDRYFWPRALGAFINGVEVALEPAKSLEEFMEKNKEVIKILRERGQEF